MAGQDLSVFNSEKFVEKLGSTAAAQYAAAYLAKLGAQSILEEVRYVDRHYIDDFRWYYANSFDAPSPQCARLHFFTLQCAEVDSWLTRAYEGADEYKSAVGELQKAYLGFIVVRPLPGASIGRTVLQTYPVEGKRHYEVVRPYRVNIAGIQLVIHGLAYQQQDRGAAVCASTALWSALQRVAHVAGHRTPTPSAITRAANSPFPASHGLDTNGMATALSKLGYVADSFLPAENRALFRAKVVACLRSQLPVILLIHKPRETAAGVIWEGHAVTVTGYSELRAVVDVPGGRKSAPPLPMKGGSLDTIYVHDDNLGSHAHYELFDADDPYNGYAALKLRRGYGPPANVQPWWQVDEWYVAEALVPKPEKLRLPIESLFAQLEWMRHGLIEGQLFDGEPLHFAASFISGVDLVRKLVHDEPRLDRERLRDFLANLSLPRFVGILSCCTEDTHLCDMIIDVSEIERDPGIPSVLGISAPGVPRLSSSMKRLIRAAQKVLQCPLIGQPMP